jgi:hypothetical protein
MGQTEAVLYGGNHQEEGGEKAEDKLEPGN